jgi:hypothetical protein
LRVGVAQTLVARALAEALAVPRTRVQQVLTGDWQPTPQFRTRLSTPGNDLADPSQPYPFYRASPQHKSGMLRLHPDRAVFWPARRTLIVAGPRRVHRLRAGGQ